MDDAHSWLNWGYSDSEDGGLAGWTFNYASLEDAAEAGQVAYPLLTYFYVARKCVTDTSLPCDEVLVTKIFNEAA